MKPSEHTELLRRVMPHRNEDVLHNEALIPKSASMLLSVLEDTTDPTDRFVLYLDVISECQFANKGAIAVEFAQVQYREIGGVASLVVYSKALVENGEVEEALMHAEEALSIAIREKTLINYAGEHYVRTAIKTTSVEKVNAALEALIRSTQFPRKGDCVLETDWIDKAEALGADAEDLAWIKAVTWEK